jgi:hypothetical protein
MTGDNGTPDIMIYWNAGSGNMLHGSCNAAGGTTGACAQVVPGHPFFTQCTTPPESLLVQEVFDGTGAFCAGFKSWDGLLNALNTAGWPVFVGVTHYGVENGILQANNTPNHFLSSMQNPSTTFIAGNNALIVDVQLTMTYLHEVQEPTTNPNDPCLSSSSGP